jgi:hypothetical protein
MHHQRVFIDSMFALQHTRTSAAWRWHLGRMIASLQHACAPAQPARTLAGRLVHRSSRPHLRHAVYWQGDI